MLALPFAENAGKVDGVARGERRGGKGFMWRKGDNFEVDEGPVGWTWERTEARKRRRDKETLDRRPCVGGPFPVGEGGPEEKGVERTLIPLLALASSMP